MTWRDRIGEFLVDAGIRLIGGGEPVRCPEEEERASPDLLGSEEGARYYGPAVTLSPEAVAMIEDGKKMFAKSVEEKPTPPLAGSAQERIALERARREMGR